MRPVKRKIGVGVWGGAQVSERKGAVAKARRGGITVRFCFIRVFGLHVENGPGLLKDDPGRKFKGHAVLMGN